MEEEDFIRVEVVTMEKFFQPLNKKKKKNEEPNKEGMNILKNFAL